MTVGDLYNMFLRLVMASKENESEFRFDPGVEGAEPLAITAVDLDELDNYTSGLLVEELSQVDAESGDRGRGTSVLLGIINGKKVVHLHHAI